MFNKRRLHENEIICWYLLTKLENDNQLQKTLKM